MQFLQPPPVPILSDAYVPIPHSLQVAASVGSYVVGATLFHLPVGQFLQVDVVRSSAYLPFTQPVHWYEVASFCDWYFPEVHESHLVADLEAATCPFPQVKQLY